MHHTSSAVVLYSFPQPPNALISHGEAGEWMGDGIDNRLCWLRAPFSSSKFRAKLIGAGAENQLQFGSISARLRAEPATTLT